MTIASILTGLAARGDPWLTSPAIRADEPHVTGFYEATTGSIQYLVADPISQKCAVIDPVLDFDLRSGSTRTTSAGRLLSHIETHELTLEWVLDTHGCKCERIGDSCEESHLPTSMRRFGRFPAGLPFRF